MAALAIQVACGFFFVSDILSSFFGFWAEPIPWQYREFIEIGAAVGLALGIGMGAIALRRSHHHRRRAEAQLRIASAAFMDVLDDQFTEWGLTPAERDVALFAIKGLTTAEIAALRQTSEGTVKAQTNAIYRKAGVSGRAQLFSHFIEDLLDVRPAERDPLAIARNGGDGLPAPRDVPEVAVPALTSRD